MKKLRMISALVASVVVLSGCNVQIFEEKQAERITSYQEYEQDELEYDLFYVKNGTRFSPVYAGSSCSNFGINGSSDKRTAAPIRSLNRARLYWFKGDEDMIPPHYKGEIIGYKSLSASAFKEVTLERFEDIGYTFGIYGGIIGPGDYYYMDREHCTVEGSYADKLLDLAPSSEIRIVSIDSQPVTNFVDPESGVFKGFEPNQKCLVEFYSGTQLYRENIYADMHMLQAYEIFTYDSSYISDTSHGYQAFSTPKDLMSGYYIINGQGFFRYYSHERGEGPDDDDMNTRYYNSEGEMIKEYSQQYSINIPQKVRDLKVTLTYGNIGDDLDRGTPIQCYAESPAGEGYYLVNNPERRTLTLELSVAQAGTWTLNVIPKSLEITNIEWDSSSVWEDTTLEDQFFTIADGQNEFKMFYVPIEGDFDSQIHGSVIAPDGQTFNLNGSTNTRFLYLQLPYMRSGDWEVKIYYYASMNTIGDIIITPYGDGLEETEIIVSPEIRPDGWEEDTEGPAEDFSSSDGTTTTTTTTPSGGTGQTGSGNSGIIHSNEYNEANNHETTVTPNTDDGMITVLPEREDP